MSRETIVPAIPDIRDDNAKAVLSAIKSTLDVREGRIGDPLDQLVTLRDLKDLSVLSVGSTTLTNGTRVPVMGPGVGNDGYDPAADLTTPPQPTGLTAAATFTNVYLSWDGAPYRNHAYTEIWRSSTNALGDAVMVGTTTTNVYSDAVSERQTYYYWIRFVSQANVSGSYNSSSGTAATTATNPATVLALLTGQITETQLYSSLASRIDLIDAPSSTVGSVNARIDVVQSQVNDLLNTPAYNNSTTYAAGAVVTYSGGLYQALSTTTGNLPTNATYWKKIGDYASLGDAVAAHTTQISTLQTNLSTEVTDRTTLATQLRGSYTGTDPSLLSTGLIYTERQARITAEGVISSQVSTLSSTVSNNYTTLNSAITSEQTARANADSALTTSVNLLQATASGFDTGISWNFDSTVEGFTGGGGTLSWSAGSIRMNSSGIDPQIGSPSISVDGSKSYLVRARIKRLAGSGWDGKIYYTTAGHTLSESYVKTIADGTYLNDWRVLEWDMSNLTNGGTDWTASTITSFRMDLGASASDQFLIDWISIGRVAPQSYSAQIASEASTRASADTALSTQISTVSARLNTGGDIYTSLVTAQTTASSKNANFVQSTTPTATKVGDLWIDTANGNVIKQWNGTTWALADDQRIGASATSVTQLTSRLNNATGSGSGVTMEQQLYTNASQIGGLQGQYSVKIDNNGYVTGFGLSSTTVNGTPTSIFMVNADKFAIVNPSVGRVQVSSISLAFGGNYIYTSSAHNLEFGNKVTFQNVYGYNSTYTVTEINSSTQFRIDTYVPYSAVTASSYVAKTVVPFIVDGGIVYMNTAVIKDATITSAMIGNLTADKITAGTLTAAISVNTGSIYGGVNPNNGYPPGSANFGNGFFIGNWGGYQQLYIGSPTANVLWNGTDLTVRGTVYATAGSFTGAIYAGTGTIGGVSIGSTSIFSNNYSAGTTGFSINSNGAAEFNGATFRGDIIVGSSPAISASNPNVMTGSGVRLYADGRMAVGDSTASMVWNSTGMRFNGIPNALTNTYVNDFDLRNNGQTTLSSQFSISRGGPVLCICSGVLYMSDPFWTSYNSSSASITCLIEVLNSAGGSVRNYYASETRDMFAGEVKIPFTIQEVTTLYSGTYSIRITGYGITLKRNSDGYLLANQTSTNIICSLGSFHFTVYEPRV